jgi:hypothetical protein
VKATPKAAGKVYCYSRCCVFDQQQLMKAVGESNTNSGEKGIHPCTFC